MRFALVLCAVLLTAVTTPARAASTPLPVPQTDYPARTTLHYALFPNAEFDCQWGFACDAGGNPVVPVFHQQTAADMGRVGGWLEYGAVRKSHHRAMAFALVASALTDSVGTATSAAATVEAQDLRDTVLQSGGTIAKRSLAALPAGSVAVVVKGGGTVLYCLGVPSTNLELDVCGSEQHQPHQTTVLWADLVTQATAALAGAVGQ